jgi:hypothetical protein
LQLAHSEEEDAFEPTAMKGKQLEDKAVIGICGGGQHALLLAKQK